MPRLAAIRATASDLRPQPHSTAANSRPVTRAAYAAASGGFLLAIAGRMPRAANSASAAATTGFAAGGISGDSRYTPLSNVLSISQTTHLTSRAPGAAGAPL